MRLGLAQAERPAALAPGRRMRLDSGLPALVWALLGVACGTPDDGGDGPSWSGEMRDSAGVLVVENLQPAAEPAVGPDPRELRTIGGPSDPAGPDLGYVADAAMAADTVFVLDALAQTVAVHGPSGARVRDIGGAGEGPGELSRFASSLLLLGDTVVVVDWGRGRAHRFLRDGTFLDAPLLGASGARSWWRKGADGRIYARMLVRYVDEASSWRGHDVLLRPPAFGSSDDALGVDTLFHFEYSETDVGGPGRPVLPLMVNAPTWEVLPDGRLAWTTLDRGELRIQTADGALERIVRHAGWSRRTPTAEEESALTTLMGDKLVALGGSRAMVDQLGPVQPEALPAVTSVRAGPGRTIWVQRMGSAGDVHPWALNTPDPPDGWGGGTWDVLDAEGRWIGAVDLGPRVRVLRITDGRVLGVRWDELGREEVVVWQVSASSG